MSSLAYRKHKLNRFVHENLAITGIGIVLISGIGNIILIFQAAGANNLGLFEMMSLNDFGNFLLVWNYNWGAFLVLLIGSFTGMFLMMLSTARR